MASVSSLPRNSFDRFQRRNALNAKFNPEAYALTLEQFHSLWRVAIQNLIATLDPTQPDFLSEITKMVSECEDDQLVIGGWVDNEIIVLLVGPHYESITHRACVGFSEDLSAEEAEAEHRLCVQMWKNYIDERKDDPESFLYERNLFLNDSMDTAVRETMAVLMMEQHLDRSDIDSE